MNTSKLWIWVWIFLGIALNCPGQQPIDPDKEQQIITELLAKLALPEALLQKIQDTEEIRGNFRSMESSTNMNELPAEKRQQWQEAWAKMQTLNAKLNQFEQEKTTAVARLKTFGPRMVPQVAALLQKEYTAPGLRNEAAAMALLLVDLLMSQPKDVKSQEAIKHWLQNASVAEPLEDRFFKKLVTMNIPGMVPALEKGLNLAGSLNRAKFLQTLWQVAQSSPQDFNRSLNAILRYIGSGKGVDVTHALNLANLFANSPQMQEEHKGLVNQALAKFANKSRSAKEILLIVQYMGKIPHRNTASLVASFLRHADVSVVRQTIQTLGKIGPNFPEGNQEAARYLLEYLKSNPELPNRLAVLQAMIPLKNLATVPEIIELLKDENPKVQKQARESLEKIAGVSFGYNVLAWQAWAEETIKRLPENNQQTQPTETETQPAETETQPAENQPTENNEQKNSPTND